jgi:fimbrial chaperone protein
MLTFERASIAVIALAAMTCSVSAASLQVAPTSVEIPAGSSAATMNVKNAGAEVLKAQVRVFRWSMVNGEEKLEPATDVVASPPLATVKPNTDYTIRLVRLSKEPVTTEQTYRIFIDEIPEPKKVTRGGLVTMAFRYSIPVFFLPASEQVPDVKWTQERHNGKLYVSATNAGGRRLRLSELAFAEGKGKPVWQSKGLSGYVLARSSKSWVAPAALQKSASPLLITAQSDSGPINAQVLPPQSR